MHCYIEMKIPCFPDCPTPLQIMIADNPEIVIQKTSDLCKNHLSIEADRCYLCFNSALYNCTIM